MNNNLHVINSVMDTQPMFIWLISCKISIMDYNSKIFQKRIVNSLWKRAISFLMYYIMKDRLIEKVTSFKSLSFWNRLLSFILKTYWNKNWVYIFGDCFSRYLRSPYLILLIIILYIPSFHTPQSLSNIFFGAISFWPSFVWHSTEVEAMCVSIATPDRHLYCLLCILNLILNPFKSIFYLERMKTFLRLF